MTSSPFKFGAVCQLKDDPSVTWRIVGFTADGFVQLTGPGPCRSIKSVLVGDLNQDWRVVESV